MADVIRGLTGTQRNVYDAIYSTLKLYGLESLANVFLGYIQEGLSADSIMLQIQQTKEWKQRFAGNEQRAKAGYAVLSPAEYIANEQAYRQLMVAEGFPPGFYDQASDFATLIGRDVSPQNLQRRIEARRAVFDATHTETASWFQQHYGVSRAQSFAAFIDPNRALPLLEKQVAAAQVGAAALATTFGELSTSTAERLAERGISEQQAMAGFGEIAGIKGLTAQLPGQEGQIVSSEDLISAEFENNAESRRRLELVKGARATEFGGGGGFATGREGVTGLREAGQ